jgi:hypothetical protein
MFMASMNQQISDFFNWLNSLHDVEKQIAAGALLALPYGVWYIVVWMMRKLSSGSRYEQWNSLAAQFYDIAKRDNDVVLPTSKRKVTVSQYSDKIQFIDGSQSHHATETETLSRVAGKLLKKSKVKHPTHLFGCEPERRWVEFVTSAIKTLDPNFARENVHSFSGLTDGDYISFDVFPFAAHLVCKHCASFERLPSP